VVAAFLFDIDQEKMLMVVNCLSLHMTTMCARVAIFSTYELPPCGLCRWVFIICVKKNYVASVELQTS